jgi:hypothetical protein
MMFVGRTETIDRDFKALLSRLALNEIARPSNVNTNPEAQAKLLEDSDLTDKIEAKTRFDAMFYNYARFMSALAPTNYDQNQMSA